MTSIIQHIRNKIGEHYSNGEVTAISRILITELLGFRDNAYFLKEKVTLTEEQQLQYGQMVGAMFENPEIHLDVTPSGNMYLHICSNEASDIDTIFTLYKGYFVELIQFSGEDFAPLTEEDKAFCLSLLHGIEFIAQ